MTVFFDTDDLLELHQFIPESQPRVFSAYNQRVDGFIGKTLRVITVGVYVDMQIGHFQAFLQTLVAGHEDRLQHNIPERIEFGVFLVFIL